MKKIVCVIIMCLLVTSASAIAQDKPDANAQKVKANLENVFLSRSSSIARMLRDAREIAPFEDMKMYSIEEFSNIMNRGELSGRWFPIGGDGVSIYVARARAYRWTYAFVYGCSVTIVTFDLTYSK